MEVAYVDTSALVAVTFGESGGVAVERRLRGFSHLLSSGLLEAELQAAFARENRSFDDNALFGISWIFPRRSLSREIAAALSAGYLRGADLWHVAVALYASRRRRGMCFVTLDNQQRAVAAALGFQT